MQAVTCDPKLFGRRLTGAVLHALLTTPFIFVLESGFLHDLQVRHLPALSATVFLLTLFNLTLVRWPAYIKVASKFIFVPLIRDGDDNEPRFLTASLLGEALTAGGKLRLVLKSTWGRIWLTVDIAFFAMSIFAFLY